MYVKAFAKINLYLDVLGNAENGYHNLDMVMLPLELHDTIELERVPRARVTHIISDTIQTQSFNSNLIYRTHELLKEQYGFDCNFIIKVHKEIPIYAGMGGGSTNAAAVLKAFNKYGKIKMEEDEQTKFCLKLGADVPFSMKNVPAHVTGIGENVEPITLGKQFSVLVIKPKEGLSTKRVFEASDNFKLKHGNVKKVIEALEKADEGMLSEYMFNSLEEVSISLCPEIQQIKDMMKKDGFKCVLMTGSGSCVYAITLNHALALKKYLKYEHKGYEVYLTKTLKQKRK